MEEIPIEKVAIDSLIEVVANGVCYRGTVVRFDAQEGKVTLNEVEMITENEAPVPMGQLRFFRGDIESMKFVDTETVMRKMDQNYLLMKPFHKPLHLRDQNVPTDEEILKLGRPGCAENSVENVGDDPIGACWSSSVNSYVIDKLDEDFMKTVALLKEQKVLAVAAEGVALSRQGELCWLVVGTQQRIYLFDIVSLGEKAFTEGLTVILQSMGILKIMHDCRFLSDYLFHKHQIFLQHVWDTQVARVVIYKNHHMGDLPCFVDSLPKTLQDVLGVDPNKFPFLWYRSYAMEEDQAVWRRRPLLDELQRLLEAQVSYLFDLRDALAEKLMLDMTIGVSTYLKVVRDARNSEVESMLKSGFLLPSEFFKDADDARERYAKSKSTSTIDPLTGSRESMGRLSYWKVRFSRDAWHSQKGSRETKEGKGDEEQVEEADLD